MPSWRFSALLVLAIAGIVAVTIWFFPTTTDFESNNPFWNGLGDLAAEFDATPIESMSDLPREPSGSVLLVIPNVEPRKADLERLTVYLEEGGVVLLADDYGYGNAVLEAFGVSTRFSGAPLLDPLFNYRTSYFPLATGIAETSLTQGVESLAMNYSTVLEGTDLTIAVRSSSFSYLDVNLDGKPQAEEPLGPFPLVGYAVVGKGRLVAVSDPSIFINGMLEAGDNSRLFGNVVGLAGSSPNVLIDRVLLKDSRLDEAQSAISSTRSVAAKPGVLAALAGILTVLVVLPALRKKGAAVGTG